MTIKKDEAINGMKTDFEHLCNLVLEQLNYLENILTSGDISVPEKLLKKIIENENDIDKSEVKLSDKVVNTIVLYQPVASELRWIMACYRIVISLERIGDLVLNIINFINKIKTPEVYGKLQEVLHNMMYQSNKMVKRSLLSMLNDDRELAIWTLKNEGVFDEGNQKLFKKILSKKNTEEGSKKLLRSIITIKEMISDIERIADHATHIAEASIYSLEGRDIRHLKIPE